MAPFRNFGLLKRTFPCLFLPSNKKVKNPRQKVKKKENVFLGDAGGQKCWIKKQKSTTKQTNIKTLKRKETKERITEIRLGTVLPSRWRNCRRNPGGTRRLVDPTPSPSSISS